MVARLKDIAQDLGLSVVTISKVLRNHPDIGEQTRKRVLKRMKELNYQPNFAARSLIAGRTWTIGLVVPDLLHPFFAQIAKGISVEVRRKGYSLLISSSDEDPALEQEEIAQLLARRVDVMLVASSQWTVESFRQFEEQEGSLHPSGPAVSRLRIELRRRGRYRSRRVGHHAPDRTGLPAHRAHSRA